MRRWLHVYARPIAFVILTLATIGLLLLLSYGLLHASMLAAMLAGVGLALDIVVAGSILITPDDLRSQATERTLRLASGTLRHMAEGLTREGCQAVCQLLLPETTAVGIAMTDNHSTLAYVGEEIASYKVGAPNSQPTSEVLQSQRMQTFSTLDKSDWSKAQASDGMTTTTVNDLFPVCIIAPLIVSEHAIGTLKLYYRQTRQVDRTQLAIARGLAELLSTQLSTHELDRQAELAARAEVKALQAQINPHFLFNTLNTIAALTRTDPVRARELLREFAIFYRRTLESSQSMIKLSDELAQTRRYLSIEKARFGDERIVFTETIEPGCGNVQVPGFIIQPIVENAVRHAMRDDGSPLHIDVQVASDEEDLMIAVIDDGFGMNEAVAEKLLEGSSQNSSKSQKGTGIALRNVAERLERYYGEGSGVEIMSKVGMGTAVTLRLVGANPNV